MFYSTVRLTGLQAAIAVVAAWGRIGRITSRLERLIALWRAGMLPAPFAARLEDLLSETECEAFRAAAPQAWRLLRPLRRMLGVGMGGRLF
jgi:hypothetical protein